MKNKKTTTTLWDIIGFLGCIAFISWLFVGAVGTVILSLL